MSHRIIWQEYLARQQDKPQQQASPTYGNGYESHPAFAANPAKNPFKYPWLHFWGDEAKKNAPIGGVLEHIPRETRNQVAGWSSMAKIDPTFNPFHDIEPPSGVKLNSMAGCPRYAKGYEDLSWEMGKMYGRLSNSPYINSYLDGDDTLLRRFVENSAVGPTDPGVSTASGYAQYDGYSGVADPTNYDTAMHEAGHQYRNFMDDMSYNTGGIFPDESKYLDYRGVPIADDVESSYSKKNGASLARERMSSIFEHLRDLEYWNGDDVLVSGQGNIARGPYGIDETGHGNEDYDAFYGINRPGYGWGPLGVTDMSEKLNEKSNEAYRRLINFMKTEFTHN